MNMSKIQICATLFKVLLCSSLVQFVYNNFRWNYKIWAALKIQAAMPNERFESYEQLFFRHLVFQFFSYSLKRISLSVCCKGSIVGIIYSLKPFELTTATLLKNKLPYYKLLSRS